MKNVLNEIRTDHCIETIRRGIMCRGDVSLGTYTYLAGTRQITSRNWAPHQCVDFESLFSWMQKHTLNIHEPGVLVPPEQLGEEHFSGAPSGRT